MPNIRKFLDISTGHLPPSERERIDDGEAGPLAYPHPDGYGWFVYVPEDPDMWQDDEDDDAMPALLACMKRARALGCDYILFDCDAPIDEELPVYNDDETPMADDPVVAEG